MRIKIGLTAIGIPFFLFSINQLILQFLKPADQTIAERLSYALQLPIFILFFTAALILVLFIFRTLKPLRLFLKNGEHYEKARKASLRIPWMLILTNSGLWIFAITFFYALQGFKTEGGVPYFWSLSTNSLSGFVSAVLAALIINRILIPAKIKLEMTEIRADEKDVFGKTKLILVFVSGFIYTALTLSYAVRYYYLSVSMGFPLIPFRWDLVLILISTLAFIPIMLAVVLTIGEDRIQRKYLKEKLDELIEGGGELNRKVNLLNFDETGEIAASINLFIEKIRTLVDKVKQTGHRVIEVSTAVEKYVESLTHETTTMLEAVNSVDDEMERQEHDFRHTRDSLSEYFKAIENITGNIEEQSASVEQTSNSIEELASSIKAINSSAREVESLTENLNDITRVGNTQIQDFINSIKMIENSSEHVAEMLEHMLTLSDQIDILAMNAAIQATHAGSFGKGFAVVAKEVKNLAKTNSEKSNEIGTHVDVMLVNVRNSNEKTSMTEKSFKDIRKNVEKTSIHFHSIFQSLEEESTEVTELLKTMTTLVSITENLKDIAGVQKESNKEMEARISGVFERFNIIRESINKQRNNRTAITDALAGMKDIAGKNLDIAGELTKQLTFFSS
ncbi:MAG TPA: methyl-accepting chemotaxis protein [Treponemataceae bacterium]|nr:methyl-accepting chemotaxis protein [Treponemataceae bacterium]